MSRLVRFANVIILLLSICVTAFTVYLVHRHGWSPLYVVFLGIVGLFVASLFLPPTLKITVSLMLASVPLSLYAGEALLRAFWPPPLTWQLEKDPTRGLAWSRDLLDDRVQLAKAAGRVFDARNRLQVIEDLEATGTPAYPTIAGNILIEDRGQQMLPLAGIARVTTVYCNEVGEYTIYQSDEHGFHNPPGLWGTRPLQVLAIGDSFAHGACVPSDQNFVALIRQQFPQTVNLGMGGIGPLRELAILKEYGSQLRPKVVLWAFFEGNDLEDISHEKEGLPRRYLTEGAFQGLIGKQAAIDAGLAVTIQRVRREIAATVEHEDTADRIERFVKVETIRTSIGLAWNHSGTATPNDTLDLLSAVLQEANRVTQTWGGKLVFVYLPQHKRYTDPAWRETDRARVLSIVHRLNLECIDIHPRFAAQADPLQLFPFRRQGHYTAEGNRVVATTILSLLQDRPASLVP